MGTRIEIAFIEPSHYKRFSVVPQPLKHEFATGISSPECSI